MTEGRQRRPGSVRADGSTVPARTRIVAWILLATGLVLLAVVLTVRSAVLADIERSSNDNVDQELTEFRTFAAEGVDPETSRPFTSGARLLEVHLQREFPGRGEVLYGYDLTADPDRPQDAAIVQNVEDPSGLTSDAAALAELATGEAESGSGELEGQPYRWGRAQVLDAQGRPSAAFVVVELLTPAQEEAADLVRLVVWVCLGGLVLTGALAFAVAGQILAPVRSVRRAAAEITRRDLGRRIEVRGRDDVAALAQTFNAMLDRLEASSRAQHRTSQAAAHHLRSYLGVLRDPATTPEQRERTATRLDAVLDDLSLLTSSALPGFADPRDEDLDHVARRLQEAAAAATPEQQWRTEVAVAGGAEVDLALLETAVVDLAVNAAAHQPAGTPLVLGVSSDDEHWQVWVQDQGPGLGEDEARHLLDRYELPRHDSSADDDAGLGLAVVRAVADAHEGSCWIESEPGAGARVGLSLPREVTRD